MSFPMNEDEQRWAEHANKLRKRAQEYDEMWLRSWQKRLGQKVRRDERLKEEAKLRTRSLARG